MDDIRRGVESTLAPVTNFFGGAIDSIARSDIGRVAGAVMAPIKATADVATDVVKGDLEGAKNHAIGAALSANPVTMGIKASRSVQNTLGTKEANNLTLGWAGDAVKSVEATDKFLDGEQGNTSDIVRYNVRSAAYATGIAAGASSGLGTQVVNGAINNPLAALSIATAASQGKYGQAGAALVENYAPGYGDIARDIIDGPKQQPAARAPASNGANTGVSLGPYDSYTVGGGMNIGLIALLGGAIMFFVFMLTRRGRR